LLNSRYWTPADPTEIAANQRHGWAVQRPPRGRQHVRSGEGLGLHC